MRNNKDTVQTSSDNEIVSNEVNNKITIMRFLDPKVDPVFRKIFGLHKDLCMSLLNGLLPLDNPIESIEYQDSELIPEIPGFKKSGVDVICKDSLQRTFVVEMQMHWTPSFKNRVLFNTAKMFVRQLHKSCEYETLMPVYSLNLVNENYLSGTDNFYHHYKIVEDIETHDQIKGMEFVFVELKKFKPTTITHKRLMSLWMRFLTELNEQVKEAPQELYEDEDVKKAVNMLEITSYDDKQLLAYDLARDAIGLERLYIVDATNKGLEQGHKEGLEQGIKKGLEQGIEKGLQQGIEKGVLQERYNIARQMKADGMSLETISRYSGFTDDEIQAI